MMRMGSSSRLWALAALQAAVTLSWMAYAYHQPKLLARFGFTDLAGLLAWYLAFAGTTLAPLAGDASDRLVRAGGNRFPVVRAGVALAGASFLAVAATAGADATSPVRFVLPLFVAVWIAGMTVFQAPALAIVRDEAGAGGVGAAMTPLVVATVLPQAAWPWVQATLDRLGGSLTFLFGGIAVVGTAVALGRTVDVSRPAADEDEAPRRGPGVLAAFAAGLASAAVVALATSVVPSMLAAHATALGADVLTAVTGVAATLTVGVGHRAGAALGSGRALVAGLAIVLVCRLAASALGNESAAIGLAVLLAVLAGGGLALHLANALPFSFAAGRSGRAGLASGLYVGGAMLGSRLLLP